MDPIQHRIFVLEGKQNSACCSCALIANAQSLADGTYCSSIVVVDGIKGAVLSDVFLDKCVGLGFLAYNAVDGSLLGMYWNYSVSSSVCDLKLHSASWY